VNPWAKNVTGLPAVDKRKSMQTSPLAASAAKPIKPTRNCAVDCGGRKFGENCGVVVCVGAQTACPRVEFVAFHEHAGKLPALRNQKPVRADSFVVPSFQLKPSSVRPSFYFGVASRSGIIGKSDRNMSLLTELEFVWDGKLQICRA